MPRGSKRGLRTVRFLLLWAAPAIPAQRHAAGGRVCPSRGGAVSHDEERVVPSTVERCDQTGRGGEAGTATALERWEWEKRRRMYVQYSTYPSFFQKSGCSRGRTGRSRSRPAPCSRTIRKGRRPSRIMSQKCDRALGLDKRDAFRVPKHLSVHKTSLLEDSAQLKASGRHPC